MQRFIKKLGNPFALVVEGFLVGAIVFASSAPTLLESHPRTPSQPLDSSVIPNRSR